MHGNHDPGEAWRADIPLPETVHVFSSEEVTGIPLMKDGEKAATIYGISYKTRHTKDDLVRSFHVNPEDGFTIGMLHTEAGVDGSPYAPCTVEELKTAGIDYWALGHVHTRKTLSMKPISSTRAIRRGWISRRSVPVAVTWSMWGPMVQ